MYSNLMLQNTSFGLSEIGLRITFCLPPMQYCKYRNSYLRNTNSSKSKRLSGACSIGNQGTTPRGCRQLWFRYYVVTTMSEQLRCLFDDFMTQRRNLNPFGPLECKMAWCDPSAALYCNAHLFFPYSALP